jgi:hypothetical protein
VLNLRFVEHVAMTALNFDNTEFSRYYAAPAELNVKIFANWSETASKE